MSVEPKYYLSQLVYRQKLHEYRVTLGLKPDPLPFKRATTILRGQFI